MKKIDSHYTSRGVIKRVIKKFSNDKISNVSLLKINDILEFEKFEKFTFKDDKDIDNFLKKDNNFYFPIKGEDIEGLEKDWQKIEDRYIKSIETLEYVITRMLDTNGFCDKSSNSIDKLIEQHKAIIFNYAKIDILRSHYNYGLIKQINIYTNEINIVRSSSFFAEYFVNELQEKISNKINDLLNGDWNLQIINIIPPFIFEPSSFIMDDNFIYVGCSKIGMITFLKRGYSFLYKNNNKIVIIPDTIKNKYTEALFSPNFLCYLEEELNEGNADKRIEIIKKEVSIHMMEMVLFNWILNFGSRGYRMWIVADIVPPWIVEIIKVLKDVIKSERYKHLNEAPTIFVKKNIVS